MEVFIPHIVILVSATIGFFAGAWWARSPKPKHESIRVVVNKEQGEPPGLPVHFAKQMTILLDEDDLDTFAEKLSAAVHGEKDKD